MAPVGRAKETAVPAVLSVEGLSLSVPGPEGPVPLLADVSLTVRAGETVGLVGESGSGKSLTVRSALGMLPDQRASPADASWSAARTSCARRARSSGGSAGPRRR